VGIEAVITGEPAPDAAVAAFVKGTLVRGVAHAHGGGYEAH